MPLLRYPPGQTQPFRPRGRELFRGPVGWGESNEKMTNFSSCFLLLVIEWVDFNRNYLPSHLLTCQKQIQQKNKY